MGKRPQDYGGTWSRKTHPVNLFRTAIPTSLPIPRLSRTATIVPASLVGSEVSGQGVSW